MIDENFYREIESSLGVEFPKKDLTKEIPFEEYSMGVNETFEIARQLGVTEFSCHVKGLPKKIVFEASFEKGKLLDE